MGFISDIMNPKKKRRKVAPTPEEDRFERSERQKKAFAIAAKNAKQEPVFLKPDDVIMPFKAGPKAKGEKNAMGIHGNRKYDIDVVAFDKDYLGGIRPRDLRDKYKLTMYQYSHLVRSRELVQRYYAYQQKKENAIAFEVAKGLVTKHNNQVEVYRERLKSRIESGLAILESAQEQPTNTKEVITHFTALEKVNRVAQTAMNIDSNKQAPQTNHPVVNIKCLSVNAAEPVLLEDHQTIDVLPLEE